MKWLTLLASLIAATAAALPSFADGDIVFAARYYNPPGRTKGTSRFHLYRINPDGTERRQITSAPFHDTEPQFSPDGRWIAFWRTKMEPPAEPGSDTWSLCIVPAAGGHVRILCSSLKADWPLFDWAMDGRSLILHYRTGYDPNARDVIERVDIRTGRVTTGDQKMLDATASDAEADHWPRYRIDAPEDVSGKEAPPTMTVNEANGTERRVPLRFTKATEEIKQSGFRLPQWAPDASFALVSTMEGNSTQGHWNRYYRVDTRTGLVTPYTRGKSLKWSPDGKRFVTLTGRDLADYDRKRDGTMRRVWVSPLYVGETATGKRTPIVRGLVYVTGADWRPKRQR